jgi:hypothetical protein
MHAESHEDGTALALLKSLSVSAKWKGELRDRHEGDRK